MDAITQVRFLTSEPLILDNDEWTAEEWAIVCKVFGVTNPAKVTQIKCAPSSPV